MLKRLLNAAVIALFACYSAGFGYVVWWSSQEPPNHQKSQASYNQQKRGTHTKDSYWGHSDPGVTLVTFLLVLVGIGQAGLFFVQLRYMRTGVKDASAAAAAAQSAAEAAKAQVALAKDQIEVTKIGIFDLERAYLSVGPTEIISAWKPPPGRGYANASDPLEVTAKLFVHNSGRTTAFLKEVYGEFSVTPPMGDVPIYANGKSVAADIAFAAGQEGVLHGYEFTNLFASPLFLWGYVEYADIFKKVHKARFCVALFASDQHAGRGKYQIAGSDGWRECD